MRLGLHDDCGFDDARRYDDV